MYAFSKRICYFIHQLCPTCIFFFLARCHTCLAGEVGPSAAGCFSSGWEDGPATAGAGLNCYRRNVSSFSSVFANMVARNTSRFGASGVRARRTGSLGEPPEAFFSVFSACPCAAEGFDVIEHGRILRLSISSLSFALARVEF